MTSDEPAEQVINLAFADADVKQRMRENGVSNSAGLGTGAWIGQKAVLTEFGSRQVSSLDFFLANLRYPSKFARWIGRDRCEGRRAGHFLLLGSATNALLQQTSESLAGRVAYLELAPFNLLEAGAKQQSNL